jgi:hypothetical protein
MPASFVSTHSYPTDYRHDADMTRSSFEDGVIAAAQIAQAANLPFVLTEMSAGLNNAYDSYFAASFIAHEAAAFLGVPNIPTMSFWTFTDVFEEPGMQSLPYAETFGMQTKWGVPKPVRVTRTTHCARPLRPAAATVTALSPNPTRAPRPSTNRATARCSSSRACQRRACPSPPPAPRRAARASGPRVARRPRSATLTPSPPSTRASARPSRSSRSSRTSISISRTLRIRQRASPLRRRRASR